MYVIKIEVLKTNNNYTGLDMKGFAELTQKD